MWFVDRLVAEWPVVQQVWLTMTVIAIATAIGVATVTYRLLKIQLDSADARLKLNEDRVAEYRRKLGHFTPDELRLQFDDLKAELTSVKDALATGPAVIVMEKETFSTPSDQPDGVPDTRLAKVCEYILKGSRWADAHGSSGLRIPVEIRDKLHMRRLSAWGRRSEGGLIERIPATEWAGLQLKAASGTAEADDGNPRWHDIQFDMDQVYDTWPLNRVI